MGNLINKSTKISTTENNKIKVENQEQLKYNSQFSLISFTTNRLNSSNRGGSQRAYSQNSRPWSRVSRRKWNDVTLSDPLNSSKTCWPVPYIESIFLPHFKVDNDNIDNKFVINTTVARGAFGKVFCVTERETNKEFALKIISKSQIIKDGSVSQLRDEVDIQTICGHHPFVVQCISFWQNRKQIFLLSEYIPCGELFDQIKAFSYQLIQIYVAEIAIVLDFLHNAGIIYRDLKPENILLDRDYHIKVIDFGLSKWLKFGNRTNTICGTLQYMAPEILTGDSYAHAVDWWALGVVACRMITNKYPSIETIKSNNSDDHDQIDRGVTNDGNEFLDNIEGTNKISNDNDTKVLDKQLLSLKEKRKIIKRIIFPQELEELNVEYKDLLNRLLEINPKFRIKSVLAIERIALFKGYSFDDVRKKKISPKTLITTQTSSSGIAVGITTNSNLNVISTTNKTSDDHIWKEFQLP